MDKESLSNKILDLFASGDQEKLQEVVSTALSLNREKAVTEMESLLFEVEGKTRLKVLELLMNDGGADLVPLFIEAVRREENVLYAKSQILLYRQFRHHEALPALLSIEKEIHPDLKATYQRALGNLLSQFSEQFYMNEFRAGVGNPRRVRFAADMMLRSPHPDYPEFLNQQILVNDMGSRLEGLRVLESLGGSASVDVMFTLMTRLRKQLRKSIDLQDVLSLEDLSIEGFFPNLCELAGVDQAADKMRLLMERVRLGDVQELLDEVIDGFELPDDIRRKVKPHFRSILTGNEPSAFDLSRIRQTADEYGQALSSLLLEEAKVMGVIAFRGEDQQFLKRLEFYLPIDEPMRDLILITTMAGYRTEESLELLTEYVNTCTEHDLLDKTLDSLIHYDVKQIPKGVEKLSYDEKNGILRQKALSLLARWGRGALVINNLMNHNSIAVRADSIRAAAEYRLDECYPKILGVLKPDTPDSLLVAALEALRVFEKSHTVRACRSLLVPPHAVSVRKAALQTLFTSGGDDGIDTIIKSFAQDTSGKLSDSIELFLTLLLKSDFTRIEPHIIRNRDFWIRLLERENETTRTKIIQLIEQLTFSESFQAAPWIQGLRTILNAYTGKTVSSNEQRLAAIVEGLEEKIRKWNLKAARFRQLDDLLDAVATENQFEKAQALRKLANSYDRELVRDNLQGLNKLLNVITTELEDEKPSTEILLQAISVASKVRHPKLHRALNHYTEFPNAAVRNAVTRALRLAIDDLFLKPIKAIFVMDDSRYMTKQLSKILTQAGYEMDFANDVMEGLKKLSKTPFDLLILDFYMPILNGVEFLQEARRRECAPEHTLVVTSARSQDELRPLVTCGIDGLLLKPFRMEDLLQRIKTLVPGTTPKTDQE